MKQIIFKTFLIFFALCFLLPVQIITGFLIWMPLKYQSPYMRKKKLTTIRQRWDYWLQDWGLFPEMLGDIFSKRDI